jgi:hypothetical protein
VGDMSSADESRGEPNEEEELGVLVSNAGCNHAKLHS